MTSKPKAYLRSFGRALRFIYACTVGIDVSLFVTSAHDILKSNLEGCQLHLSGHVDERKKIKFLVDSSVYRRLDSVKKIKKIIFNRLEIKFV